MTFVRRCSQGPVGVATTGPDLAEGGEKVSSAVEFDRPVCQRV
jgi:hypothetical protein